MEPRCSSSSRGTDALEPFFAIGGIVWFVVCGIATTPIWIPVLVVAWVTDNHARLQWLSDAMGTIANCIAQICLTPLELATGCRDPYGDG
jgi:hypothetical protein